MVVYFKADNPGYWFLHCHIEVHQLEGMGVIIRAGERQEHQDIPNGFPTCSNFEWTVDKYNAAIANVANSNVDNVKADAVARDVVDGASANQYYAWLVVVATAGVLALVL